MAVDSRERLLEAASELMHLRGYEAVGVAELCAHARVKRGSFYHFFDSKQSLALAMLDASWRDVERTLFAESINDPALGAIEAITRYGNLLAEHQQRVLERCSMMPGCRFGNFAGELATRDDVIRRRVVEILHEMIDRVERCLLRGIERGELPVDTDARRSARSIVAHMEGMMLLAKAEGDPTPLRALGGTAGALLRCSVPDPSR